MVSYLLDRHIEGQLRTVNAGYRQKAVAVAEAMTRLLGPHVEQCRGGSAGFYYYLTLRDTRTEAGSSFFNKLAKPADPAQPKVIYIPGQYCVHSKGDLAGIGLRQMRLSYGFERVHRIVEALDLMRRAIED
jgi:DNA-binding transcriptional MocR family regulator